MDVNKAIQLAIENHKAGNLQQAELLYRKILRKRPNDVDALHLLGVLCYQRGDYDSATKYIRKALKLDAGFAEAYNNLGNVTRDKGQIDEAETYYQKALEIDPNFAIANNNLGNIYVEKKLLDKAICFLGKALQINPHFAEAYNNMGRALAEKNNLDEAIGNYQKALQINPHFAEAYNNMGAALRDKGSLDQSIYYYQKALQVNPSFVDAYYNLGNVLYEHNKQNEAIAAFDRVILYKPDHFMAHWVRCMSHLKVIYQDLDDILNSRKRYVDELIKLRDMIFSGPLQNIESAAQAVGSSQPFLLAYQGLIDKEIQQIYGDLVCRIMASRYPEWANVTPTMPFIASEKSVRVGIVSGHFYHHSVWKIPIRGWIMNIDKQRFSLYGYYTGKTKDEETEIARQYFDYFVEDIYSFEELCRHIREDNLHILIYPEIGMDPMTVKLAALKLAPVQVVSWGHPDTSGLPTMDYYLSSDLIEPSNADDHYTEKLVRLPNISIYYSPMEVSYADINRDTFRLRRTSVLYHCCQSLYKYLPQYDEVFPRIACQVGDCQFLFSSDKKSSGVTEKFQLRIQHAFHRFGLNADDFAVFLPFLEMSRYNALYSLADVFLDPIGWSGCNTALEAIAHNLPVVTFPSMLMRGRETSAILTMMSMTETIAKTIDEYIEISVKLGKDSNWRQNISKQIEEKKYSIYNDTTCIQALEDFLMMVARKN
jgi:protein O-GlcNAc transferase